jgi:hypothetical protein
MALLIFSILIYYLLTGPNNMKKIILASLMFALPFVANAASFVISPSSGSYTVGDNVTLHISVDPAGSNIYAAMLDAKFSSATFEVMSFTLNDSMLAMKQAGDSIDNTNGVLVKTGGYTGGIISVTPFGTVVLKAKASGTGTFTANSTSKLLDSNNTNQQSGSQTASFTIANPAPVVVPKVQVQTNTNTSVKTVIPAIKKTATTEKTSDIQATSSEVAAVVQSGTKSSVTFWIFEILAMAVMFALGYFAGRRNWLKI